MILYTYILRGRKYLSNIAKSYFFKGVKDGVPIFLGYLAVSFTFGIAAEKTGLTPLEASLMSASNLTSAGQFASLDIIKAGAPYIELIITQIIINLRYCLMSASLTQKMSPNVSTANRLLMSFGVTDEIFGAASAVRGKLKPAYMYGLIIISLIGWTLGTCLGSLLGEVMHPKFMSAFSVALYAMFVAIIIPPSIGDKTVTSAVYISMALSGLFYIAPALNQISSGFRIIILTAAVSAVFAALKPVDATERS